jgi:hypothetical protein
VEESKTSVFQVMDELDQVAKVIVKEEEKEDILMENEEELIPVREDTSMFEMHSDTTSDYSALRVSVNEVTT